MKEPTQVRTGKFPENWKDSMVISVDKTANTIKYKNTVS